MLKMQDAPKDGTRILLLYRPLKFNFRFKEFLPEGKKWEECWWCKKEQSTEAHWQPWEGSYKSRSTKHILNAIGWLPLPQTGE
jgi:hypothetical protein